jgi:hypothetical protein
MSGQRRMAEPPVGHPPASADGLDGVLATKLYLPRPQQGFVPRPRLVERLEEALARGLVVVCAPAGFGKTVLLADWARQQRRPVAWLSLDPGDNDPVRFWRHAAAALDLTRPGLAERLAPLLGPPAPASFEGLVTALINRLASQQGDGEALLVLDDYHLIDAQPVHASVGFLWSTAHRPCAWCWPAAPTRRWLWRGCGPAASWPSYASATCASPPRRRRRCCARRSGPTCPRSR